MVQADMDARLARLALRAARDGAAVQDIIDCADMARATGRDAIAARLDGLVTLLMGWGQVLQTGFSVDLAVDELRTLMQLEVRLTADEIRFPPIDPGPHQRLAVAPVQVAQITTRIDALLADMPALVGGEKLTDRLSALSGDVLALPPLPPNEHVSADPETLIALLVLQHVRKFLVVNYDLLRAETNSQPLFDRAARLGRATLGPYFGNVRMLIRNARDVLALIEAAGDQPSRETVETWCVLLSAHLHNHQLVDLADELGDRGMVVALAHFLTRLARADGPHYPLDPVWRIRDVSLDLGEWDIAADAQQLIALWRPRDPNEWRILAEIRIEVGDKVGVGSALERALLMSPDDFAARQRLTAYKAGAMPKIAGGYGTPPGRRRVRQARLKAYRLIA